MTEAELEERFPTISWREPISITVPGLAAGFGCRFCIANYGLRGQDVGKLPQSREEYDEHMALLHPRT